MEYKIIYTYKGIKRKIIIQYANNILGALGIFYEEHDRECEVLKIQKY